MAKGKEDHRSLGFVKDIPGDSEDSTKYGITSWPFYVTKIISKLRIPISIQVHFSLGIKQKSSLRRSAVQNKAVWSATGPIGKRLQMR